MLEHPRPSRNQSHLFDLLLPLSVSNAGWEHFLLFFYFLEQWRKNCEDLWFSLYIFSIWHVIVSKRITVSITYPRNMICDGCSVFNWRLIIIPLFPSLFHFSPYNFCYFNTRILFTQHTYFILYFVALTVLLIIYPRKYKVTVLLINIAEIKLSSTYLDVFIIACLSIRPLFYKAFFYPNCKRCKFTFFIYFIWVNSISNLTLVLSRKDIQKEYRNQFIKQCSTKSSAALL